MIYDVAIIGAGPGGYVAAIRASQLGLSVCLIEKEKVGGVCLNWGCIPSKNLLHHASNIEQAKTLENLGAKIDFSTIDYAKAQGDSRDVAAKLSEGIDYLLNKNKVMLIKGLAEILSAKKIAVTTLNTKGNKVVSEIISNNIIVATGSKPMQVPGFEFDGKQVLSSNDILAMTQLPKSLVILGGGAIGCEFAYIMNAFGVKVTIVEMSDYLLPNEDHETTQVLVQSFKKNGIAVKTSTKAEKLVRSTHNVEVHLTHKQDSLVVNADAVLVVFGRVPNTANLGLETLGIKIDKRGYLNVGDFGQTTQQGVFAIGDITLTPALAHVASKEGEICVEYIANKLGKANTPHCRMVDTQIVPSAIYTEPQVAGFGLREQDAKVNGVDYKSSSLPLSAIGKAVATHHTEGVIKTLVDAKTGEILGAHIVGENATELIHQILQAKNTELLAEDIGEMIHAHPTFSEVIMEQMRGIYDKPIHM